MFTVAHHCIVSIRYTMKNKAGDMLENTMNSMPVSYLHGAAGILPMLQGQLAGLKQGDKKIVLMYAQEGLATEDFVFDVVIDEVRAALPEEILLGYPVQPAGQPCEADCSCYRGVRCDF